MVLGRNVSRGVAECFLVSVCRVVLQVLDVLQWSRLDSVLC